MGGWGLFEGRSTNLIFELFGGCIFEKGANLKGGTNLNKYSM